MAQPLRTGQPASAPVGDEVAVRLVDSARRLLFEEGLDQVTMRSVAVGAGVSTMNVYSRFGSKDGLLDVLYREGFEALGAELAAIDETALVDQIRACAAAYRRFALEHPARYELMFAGTERGFQPSDESRTVARSVLAVVAGHVAAAADRGELRLPDGGDSLQVASVLWAMCHGTAAFELRNVAPALVDWSVVSQVGVDALIDRHCR